MNSFLKKIQNTNNKYGLWKENSGIVLGISGGPDSMALLDIFSKLSQKYRLKLHIAHINYGLRGKDSDEDENFVRSEAAKYGVGISVLKAKKVGSRVNLENKLREIRYGFFEKIRKEVNFDLVAVAHTLDDQAETVIMRIIRGSGMLGIQGMKMRNKSIIRPFLDIKKKELVHYLNYNKILFRTDKTNKENIFLRNKVRNKLIPYLEKNFNPSIKESLYSLSLTVSDDYEFILKKVKSETKKIVDFSKKKSAASFSRKRFNALSSSIQRGIIRECIQTVGKNISDVEVSNVEEIRKTLRSAKGKHQIVSFRGLKLSAKGDKVTLSIK